MTTTARTSPTLRVDTSNAPGLRFTSAESRRRPLNLSRLQPADDRDGLLTGLRVGGSESFQRGADSFCFRDHCRDRHFEIASWFAPGPLFDLARHLHQPHPPKMPPAALHTLSRAPD